MRLLWLTPDVLRPLADGDLAAASTAAGVGLPHLFVTPRSVWLWNYRLGQLAETPADAAWIGRYAAIADGIVVGHIGPHGAPDDRGMVEVGYVVAAEHRRRGHARAMLVEFLAVLAARAAAGEDVRVLRACVGPDNAASLATIAPFGFALVGEQWDEEDGRELVYERPIAATAVPDVS